MLLGSEDCKEEDYIDIGFEQATDSEVLRRIYYTRFIQLCVNKVATLVMFYMCVVYLPFLYYVDVPP